MIFTVDDTNSSSSIVFTSYKSRQVTRYPISGEVISFSNMFDTAVSISQEIPVLLARKIPLQLLIDGKSLFDIIYKG